MDKNIIEYHKQRCNETRKIIGPGPWDAEPDRIEFIHAGLNCLMSRVPDSFHWCGYVRLPNSHPLSGKNYDEVECDVHGALTYSNPCNHVVCHVPALGETDDLYWFGFDCAHAGDVSPGNDARLRGYIRCSRDGTYKDVSYVIHETKRLAEFFSQKSI